LRRSRGIENKDQDIFFSKILAYVVSPGGRAASKKLELKEPGKNIEGAVVMERIL
jgi:hypothetical protein